MLLPSMSMTHNITKVGETSTGPRHPPWGLPTPPDPLVEKGWWAVLLTAPPLQITDYLYLGGDDSTSDLKFLSETCGITHILNCTKECRNHFPEDFR